MPTPTIVMIDDEPLACRLFKRLLGEEGYLVFTATTATQGLALIQRKSPDIVFLDMKMPRQSGLAILKRIRHLKQGIAAIILTGYASLATVRAAMALGAYDYVTKPFDVETIKRSIRDALEAKSEGTLKRGLTLERRSTTLLRR